MAASYLPTIIHTGTAVPRDSHMLKSSVFIDKMSVRVVRTCVRPSGESVRPETRLRFLAQVEFQDIFLEDNIFGTSASLTYGPKLQ